MGCQRGRLNRLPTMYYHFYYVKVNTKLMNQYPGITREPTIAMLGVHKGHKDS